VGGPEEEKAMTNHVPLSKAERYAIIGFVVGVLSVIVDVRFFA
jgi:hypothetical protein